MMCMRTHVCVYVCARVPAQEPHISISSVESTNRARAFRKIPMAAVGRLSVHFVPDQNAEYLISCLRTHLEGSNISSQTPDTSHQ